MQLNITSQVKNIGINIDIKEGLNLCFIKHIAAWVFILVKVLGEYQFYNALTPPILTA